MEAKYDKSSDLGEVQVFELTMDNTEDQDELNRQLRRPGEPVSAKVETRAQGESKTEASN